ncbi:ErfK/YbiS/YcfS/YnhG family protein [Gemmatirosa kalamazoonensis]|uniref:ErfK/YbiS/YcfS/YnhG family protein n=1 Tax=Gemmatirosa kalamazoonensis TaxID=861299 RepID=W0RFG0_9BACT|nr:L,D-transpeptidase family protein [Gemmatirosa kalamazoonensis]AHG89531.1 ErfK/YbiS/YcfS/YnhG family protein [Gemmatirosa kalamazoonensis]
MSSQMLQPPIRSFRRLALVATAPLLALGACKARDTRTASGAVETTQSGGEVTRSWNPPAVTAVQGVPAATLRSAIQQRLAGAKPQGFNDDHWAHAKKLYKSYGQSPLWMNEDGLISQRVQALTTAMLDADSSDALDLSEYPFAELTQALQTMRSNGGHGSAEQLADVDVLLTASYAALGEDLMVGQVSPSSVNQNWHIDPRDEAMDGLLMRGLATDALDQSIGGMRPQGPEYEGLRKALSQYRQIAARGGWGTVPAGKALKPGQHDDPARLQALRARLSAEGYQVSTAAPAAPAAPTSAPPDSAGTRSTATGAPAASGVYDRELAGAVARFQAAHAIDVDSILGTGTVESMNKPVDYRLAQIAANMERMRWMPRSLGSRYIYVNVPAFRLEAYDSSKKVLEMKVVVGQNYEDKTTPAFADSMEMVVFRPYWNITPDIQAKEIEPKIAADPSYMEENQLEYFKDGGETRIRQRPGEKNSLGYVKFLFPNSFNIYLHDTPAKDLFDKDVRAFSHGCIRVEKPAELAEWVLDWPAEKVDAAMHSGPDNRTVKLPRKIPVYITYFTAFATDDGLHFGNDLYDRDDALVQLTTKTASTNAAVRQAVSGLRQVLSR